MAVKKITKRWLFNSLGVILVILIALEVVIAFSVKDYYYGSVERVVYSQAETVSGHHLLRLFNGFACGQLRMLCQYVFGHCIAVGCDNAGNDEQQ